MKLSRCVIPGLTALLLIGLALVPAMSVQAANPEPFAVRVTIRQAITITNTGDLDFGTVEQVGGSYTVLAGAGPHTAGVGAAAATFTVQGESSATADFAFTTNPVTITNGTDTLSATLTLAAPTHTFSGVAETIYVGGAITVAGTESAGIYTGTAELSMIYQ